MKNVGAIIQIVDKKALVLTSPGKFVYVKVSNSHEIGDLISFDESMIINKKNWVKRLSSVAAVFVGVIILGIVLSMMFKFHSKQTLAVVSLDINPSLELNVSKDLKIIRVQTFNEDAAKVLSGMNLTNTGLGDAITKIVTRSVDLGYLKSNRQNYVLLSWALLDTIPNGSNTLKKDLDSTINGIVNESDLNKKISIHWKVLQGSPGQLSLSSNNGISLGRYILYDNENRNNTSVNLKEYEKEDILNLIKTSENSELSSGKSESRRNTPTYTPAPYITSLTTATPSPKLNKYPHDNYMKNVICTPTPTESNQKNIFQEAETGNNHKDIKETPIPTASSSVSPDTSNSNVDDHNDTIDPVRPTSLPNNADKTEDRDNYTVKTPVPAATPSIDQNTENNHQSGNDNQDHQNNQGNQDHQDNQGNQDHQDNQDNQGNQDHQKVDNTPQSPGSEIVNDSASGTDTGSNNNN